MGKAYLTAGGTRVLDTTEHYRRAGLALREQGEKREQVDWAALGWRMTQAALWITIGCVAGLVMAAVQYGRMP
jgi:disulfide bond formation protein DsbB